MYVAGLKETGASTQKSVKVQVQRGLNVKPTVYGQAFGPNE